MDAEAVRTRLEQWRAAHVQATFEEIEDEVYRQLASLHADLVGALAQPPSAATSAHGAPRPRCAACDEVLHPSGQRQRRVVTRMGATTTLRRPYWVCPACGAGVFPPG